MAYVRFQRVREGGGGAGRCDGRCRHWLPEWAWFYGCAAGCDIDVCVACVAELRPRGASVQASGGARGRYPAQAATPAVKTARGPRRGGGGCGRDSSAQVPVGAGEDGVLAPLPPSVLRATFGPPVFVPPPVYTV